MSQKLDTATATTPDWLMLAWQFIVSVMAESVALLAEAQLAEISVAWQ